MDALKNSQKEVLVCIPAYNAEDTIWETLESILSQTYESFDILVIDNKSTDKTAEKAQQCQSQLERGSSIYLLVNKENLGRIGNWNECLRIFQNTSHTYLKFVFTGDTLEKTCIEQLIGVFKDYPRLGFAASGYYVHSREGKTMKKISFVKPMFCNIRTALRFFFQKGNWVGAPIACMFSRKAVGSLGFSEKLSWGADWKFCMDISRNFDSFYIPDLLGNFHIAQRKHYQAYNLDFSTRAEELYLRFYAFFHLLMNIV